MKKIYLLLVFCLLFVQLKAQNGVVFKIKYTPNHIYETNIDMDMNMEMNISGPEKEMEAIKQKGIKLPMIMVNNTQMAIGIKTGTVDTSNNFPIAFNYKNINSTKTINGEEINTKPSPIVGRTIYGQYNTSGGMHLDSISGKGFDESFKQALFKTIGQLVNQLHFPDRAMNIGDTFTQEVPFSLPVSGINMQFSIKIIYKLSSIQNGLAYFDLDQSMKLDMSTQNNGVSMTLKGSGSGDGKLIYSVDQNYATAHTSNFDFKYQMLIKDMTMTGKAKISSNYQTKITEAGK